MLGDAAELNQKVCRQNRGPTEKLDVCMNVMYAWVELCCPVDLQNSERFN